MKAILIAACTLAVLAAAPPAAARSRGGQFQQDVEKLVRDHPQFTIFDDVDVRVEEGAVILGGKVTTPGKRKDIERRVARIDGVREVRNQIAVLPSLPADDELRRRVARAIYGSPSFWSYAALPRPPIHIIVERGHVTLRGTVNTHADRTMARSLATGLGESGVINELIVR
jgi:osmotically-inducible protein OsmY